MVLCIDFELKAVFDKYNRAWPWSLDMNKQNIMTNHHEDVTLNLHTQYPYRSPQNNCPHNCSVNDDMKPKIMK